MLDTCMQHTSNALQYAREYGLQFFGVIGLLMLAGKCRSGMKKPRVTDKVVFDKQTKSGVTGVMLVNLGTPESLSVPAVRRFLSEFLIDERVIDAPAYVRWVLVNCIIAPFRGPGSTEMYGRIWDSELKDSNKGSPIMSHSLNLLRGVKAQLEKKSPGKYSVELAMRYQTPSMESALMRLRKQCVDHIIVIPLFPQYSSSCTGSVFAKVFDIMKTWDRMPHLTLSASLLEAPGFVEGFVDNAKDLMKNEYDHYMFSYHGIPEKQITKGSLECRLDSPETGCCSKLTERNRGCYRAQCYETSRRIAQHAGIPKEKYTVTFQSRLGPTRWLQPYTDEFADKLPSEGKKRVLVFSPAFVADCLETVDEIGSEIKHGFIEKGGERFDLVPSLNATPIFVKSIADHVAKLSVF
ncbi:Ferrochelatase [Diplonema papillatum]|nr:Ferrochelatase [Diplonema papillatum]